MAKQLQLRRGTTVQNDAFTGAIGELTMDTDTKQLRLHDGATLGGCGTIDPVVASQVPTSGNNQTWYRKYASGWVEMGGRATIPGRTGGGSNYTIITLPVAMADTNYTPMITITTGGNYWGNANTSAREPTTTQLKLIAYWNISSGTTDNLPVAWQVSGMAA